MTLDASNVTVHMCESTGMDFPSEWIQSNPWKFISVGLGERVQDRVMNI